MLVQKIININRKGAQFDKQCLLFFFLCSGREMREIWISLTAYLNSVYVVIPQFHLTCGYGSQETLKPFLILPVTSWSDLGGTITSLPFSFLFYLQKGNSNNFLCLPSLFWWLTMLHSVSLGRKVVGKSACVAERVRL